MSSGIDNGPTAMAGAPNGDVYVADITGTVTRVDHATGATKVIRLDHDETFPIRDLAVDKDGSPLALLAEDQGTSLVRINSTTGALTKLSDDQLFSDPQDLAIEWDGKVVVTDRNRLIRVNPGNGAQQLVTTFAVEARALTVRRDGQIFVRTLADAANPPKLIQVDPLTGATNTNSMGGRLQPFSNGMSFENGTSLIAAEPGFGSTDGRSHVVRVNTLTGGQELLSTGDEEQEQDVVVAGVDQLPPVPLPHVGRDSFSVVEHGQVQGNVLTNDSDPLGQQLTAVQAEKPTHGFTSFNSDGSFFYFPDAGFVGTDSFTYRAVAGSRQSRAVLVFINVTALPKPVAKGDNFFMSARPVR